MATHSSILAWRTPQTRGAWWATVHEGPDESDTTERLTQQLFGASLVAQLVQNPPAMRETWVQSLTWEDPLEGMTTHSSILAWRIPKDRGAWWVAVHGAANSWTRLTTKHGLCSYLCVPAPEGRTIDKFLCLQIPLMWRLKLTDYRHVQSHTCNQRQKFQIS